MVKKNKAIFFDRDGILIKAPIIKKKPKSIKTLNELKFTKNIKKICKFYKKNFLLIMITNQPDVARGKVKKEVIENINNFIKSKLLIDEIFTCYHDNHDQCECRKPKPGAFFVLAKKYNIDITRSIMVGDRAKDIEAAKNANIPSIFIDYGYNEMKPTEQKYTIKSATELLRCLENHYE